MTVELPSSARKERPKVSGRVTMLTMCCLLALATKAAFALPLAPQVAQDTTRDTTAVTAGPTAIAASQIGGAAEAAVSHLVEIRAGLAPDAAVFTIDSSLVDFNENLEELKQRSDSAGLAGLSLRTLDDRLSQWLTREEQLRRWQQTLEAESRKLDQVRDTLAAIRQEWEATQESAAEQELPEAMIETIQQILDNVGEAQEELVVWRDEILTILSRVSLAGTEVAQGKGRVEQASAVARRSILTPESPPLWQALVSIEDTLSAGQHLRSSWEHNTTQMAEFIASREQQILVQLGLFIALVALMFAIRRSGKGWENDEALQASSHILSRPFSTALVLTLLGTRLFHPRAPAVVYELAGFLWLIPTLRLVPGILKPSMRLPAYGLMGLYALSQVGDLTSDFAISARLMLLTLTILALVGLAFTIRAEGGARIPGTGKWHLILIFASRLTLILLGISLIANVLGFVRLASILTRGTLSSGFTALIALVLVEVMTGVIKVLLRRGPVLWLQSVRVSYGNLTRRVTALVKLGVFLLWFYGVLRAFGIHDIAWNALTGILGRQWAVGSWEISLGDVIAFALTLWLSLWISRIIRVLLKEDVLPKMQLARGVPETISALATYVVLIIGFLIAAGAAGVDLTRITLLAGALGVGIGFGLQSVVNNFISGLILMFERPIQIGDTIDIEGLRGEVKRIGIRASVVRTFDGAEVIVPNGDLISGRVTNWTLSDRLRRVELPVGVKYGTDPKVVLEILVEAARKHEDVLDDPAPVGLFVGFGDSSLDFKLRFWTAKFDSWIQISSEVAVNMNDDLAAAGIEIPFPQRDLHLKSMEESVKQALTKGRHEALDG
jgi:potassium efflux system protein